MDLNSLLLVLFVFTAWGLDTFFSKLAANRIAGQSSLWYALGFVLPIIVYAWFAFGRRGLALQSRSGVALSLLAGAFCGAGMIGFLILLSRNPATTVVPLTGLYPALTAVLAVVFLRESITVPKVLGIVLSMAAVYLLIS
jgi:transporter family protein